MILIGLHGPKGSGKDLVFTRIARAMAQHDQGVKRRAFADPLKRILAEGLGFRSIGSGTDLVINRLKTEGRVQTHLSPGSLGHIQTGRQVLQNFGDSMRNVIDKDIWVDACLPLYDPEKFHAIWQVGGRLPALGVVTDVRHHNEAERVIHFGGRIYRVERGIVNDDPHVTEQPLPDKYIHGTIDNRGDILDLDEEVQRLLGEEFIW